MVTDVAHQANVPLFVILSFTAGFNLFIKHCPYSPNTVFFCFQQFFLFANVLKESNDYTGWQLLRMAGVCLKELFNNVLSFIMHSTSLEW